MSASLLEQLQMHYQQIHAKDALTSVRENAWEKFLLLGLPQKKEGYRHVQLSTLFAAYMAPTSALPFTQKFNQAVLPECKNALIVFVDGHFAPHLSDLSGSPNLQLLSLSSAMQPWRHFLQKHFEKRIKEEKDPFALLNLALHPEGAFLYIPPKQAATVHCLFIQTKQSPLNTARLQVVVGKQSNLRLVTTHYAVQEGAPCCSNNALDLFLDDEAQVDLCAHLAQADWCFENLRAELRRGSALRSISLLSGSKATRHDIAVQCAAENSSATLKGLWMLEAFERAHIHAAVEHAAPHTQSHQLFKGILQDASQSSVDGKILVDPIAQKTESYQLCKHLLLSDTVVAHTEPTLEIFADDVKASHGATIARPDALQLFYLKSRGIDEKEATELLIHSFYREILDQVPYLELREKFL
jgi:Fe-S cluster assembly protein SufD